MAQGAGVILGGADALCMQSMVQAIMVVPHQLDGQIYAAMQDMQGHVQVRLPVKTLTDQQAHASMTVLA